MLVAVVVHQGDGLNSTTTYESSLHRRLTNPVPLCALQLAIWSQRWQRQLPLRSCLWQWTLAADGWLVSCAFQGCLAAWRRKAAVLRSCQLPVGLIDWVERCRAARVCVYVDWWLQKAVQKSTGRGVAWCPSADSLRHEALVKSQVHWQCVLLRAGQGLSDGATPPRRLFPYNPW